MDKLKEILAQKKPKQKIVNQKQVISKQRQAIAAEYQQQKKLKEIEGQKRLRDIQKFYDKGHKMKPSQQEPQAPIKEQQLKTKLRSLYQPVTLFGQTNYRRYLRYLKAQKFHEQNPNQDMKMYDEEFAKKIKQNQQYQTLDAKYRQQMIEPKLLDNLAFREKKMAMILKQKDREFGEMCNQVYLWIRKVLNGWAEALEHKNHDKKHLDAVRKRFELYQQTEGELNSFQRVLKAHKGDKDMITSIYHIMNCCLVREYVKANDKYLQLSIGNAPWPMGEAMLSISVKKNSQKLSHVLDEQMTRRWMQGIKRLITVSQQLYPNQQSIKMATFTVNKMT